RAQLITLSKSIPCICLVPPSRGCGSFAMFLLASIKQYAADRKMLHTFYGARETQGWTPNSRRGVAGHGFWPCHKQFGSHFRPEVGLWTLPPTVAGIPPERRARNM